MMKFIIILTALLAVVACETQRQPILNKESQPDTDALLQAVSIIDENVAWLSGHKATFVRTQDGGASWEVFNHPTADTLQFRDVYAFDADNIVLMSAGEGSSSRIYQVKNGSVWNETFVMDHPKGFLDCMDFWDDKRGIVYGDSFDGYPYILITSDAGKSWSRVPQSNLPKAGEGEGGFAASGTCVQTGKNGLAWIVTGASGNARILKTTDYGKTWNTYESPMVKGEFAGHTSVHFISETDGFVTGGDLAITDAYSDNCAFTTDGGETWTLTKNPQTKGAFYGSSRWKDLTLVCGPNGLDVTLDRGSNWIQLDSANYWAIDIHPSGIGWASGKDGVSKIIIE